MPKLRKTCVCCILSVLNLGAVFSVQAAPRTFTSPDGRTLQAEVQSATPDMVTLKMATGQTLTVPVTKFSDADQTFIAEWRKANPAATKYAFAASYTKEKKDSTKSMSGNAELTTETWVCNLKLANRSSQTLEDVKVDYEIFCTKINNGQAVQQRLKGSSDVGSIKHLEEVVIPSLEVKLYTTKLEGGFYYLDGSRSRKKDEIDGVVIRVTHAGQKVFEWASSGVPKDNGADAKKESAPAVK